MPVMAENKKQDRHKQARKALQLPEAWYAVAESLAEDSKMPVSWYVIDLLLKAAQDAKKADLPAVPWKTSGE